MSDERKRKSHFQAVKIFSRDGDVDVKLQNLNEMKIVVPAIRRRAEREREEKRREKEAGNLPNYSRPEERQHLPKNCRL